jgi:O-antigen/teichoic acid export membrane protein
MATGQTKIWGFCQYGSAVVMTVAYIALIPRFGLMGAATAQCVTLLATFITVYFLSRRYYDPEIKLMPVAVFSAIALGAYFCGDVLARFSSLGVDLLIKFVTMVVATALTGLVAIRAIRAIDLSMLDSLPWPLHRLGQLELRRLLGS